MTDLDTGPSSIRDDSICESSLPPNKSSGDIGELKPCPWCGSTASRVRIMSRDAIQCDGENCGVIKRTPDEWNTRTPDPESAAEIERLRRDMHLMGLERDRIARNRDMWKGQCERQADQLRQRSALTAESAVAAAYENAAKIAEAKALEFLSPEYATGQPLSSFNERFACEQVASAIRAAVSKKTAESGHSPSTHNSESE